MGLNLRRYLSPGFILGSVVLGTSIGVIGILMRLDELQFVIVNFSCSLGYAWLYPVRPK